MNLTSKQIWLSPPSKLRLMLLISIAVLMISQLQALIFIYAGVLFAYFANSRSRQHFPKLVIITVAAIWGFIVTQAFFYPYYPRTELWQLISPSAPIIGHLTGGVSVYLEGVYYGIIQALRFVILLTAGMSVVWSSSPVELLKGMQSLGLPYRLAFLASTALRFIPIIMKETGSVLAAMKMRGYPLSRLRPWGYFSAISRAIMPILYRNIRRAAVLSDSLDCRGFAIRDDSVKPSKPLMPGNEKILLSLLSLIFSLLIVVKLLHILAIKNYLQIENLRWIYELVQKYL
jgi:energy-coupling factor transport system permease protein